MGYYLRQPASSAAGEFIFGLADPMKRELQSEGTRRVDLALCLCVLSLAAEICGAREPAPVPSPRWGGAKTAWHGFDRYDFLMDEASLAVEPMQAAADEKDGIRHQIEGQRRCIVVVPREAASGRPWSWRGCYWDHQPQTEVELLQRGFHIAYVESSATLKPGRQWDAWYAFLTEKHGLSRKPAFIGMSRGGEYAYTWATANPDKVSCIYADNPGGNPEVLMKLGQLAQYDVPLLEVCGSIDPLLGRYALPIESIYQQFGGRVSLMIKEGAGHHPHSLQDPKPIADFIEQSVQSASNPPPAFVGREFTRTSYYGAQNSYRQLPPGRDLGDLPRTVVHPVLRPLSLSVGWGRGRYYGHCAESCSARQTVGVPGGLCGQGCGGGPGPAGEGVSYRHWPSSPRA